VGRYAGTVRQGSIAWQEDAISPPLSLRSIPTFASGAAVTTAAVIATLGARAGTRTAHRIQPILRAWSRGWLVPAGVHLRIEHAERIEPGQQYVVVSNHLSNLDPMVHLGGVRLPLRFLAMRELFDLPVIGNAMRRIGMIEVDRGNADSAEISRGVRTALRDGASLLVYPEGETSHDGSLGRFHIGAFALAIEHGLPVLPIATIGTREIWAPGSNAIRSGAVVLLVQEPLPTHGMSRLDAIGLRERTRAAIAAACHEPVHEER